MPEIKTIDMHSHILPNVDHGCSAVNMSVELVKIAKDNGVEAIAATPHFYLHKTDIDSFFEKREESYEKLMSALEENHIDGIKIIKGAEVTLETGLTELETSKLARLCYENTGYILIEMPFVPWSGWVFNSLRRLSSRHGLTPIIAHIERYSDPLIDDLYEMSPLAQVNADSIANIFSRKKIVSMLRNKVVHVIGSDLHDTKNRNYDHFIIVKNKLSSDILSQVYGFSKAVLDDSNIEF